MVHLVIGQIECVTLDMQFSFFFEGEQNWKSRFSAVFAVDSDSTWCAEDSEFISYSNYSNRVNDSCFLFFFFPCGNKYNL